MSPRAHTPIDILWQPRLLVWTVATCLGLALVLTLAPPAPPAGGLLEAIEHFGLMALAFAWVAMLTIAGLWIVRRWIGRFSPAGIGLMGLAMMLVATWIVGMLAGAALGPPGTPESMAPPLLRFSGIALTVGLLGLVAFLTLWHNTELRADTRRAEHAALQARVNPHFLFNTLNTAISLVRQQPERAERLLEDLSDLFRAALAASRPIPLSEELDLSRRYLDIEQLRLGARLELRWMQPPVLPAIVVPALLVQPLVENAVRHGIEPSGSGGLIEVDIRVERETVLIRITNPRSPAGARIPGHHVGQSAVRSRLETATDRRGRLTTSEQDDRYVALLEIPLG